MNWQEFESVTRTIASAKWDAVAKPEEINGVKVDCVLKIKPDYWILIEITQEESLSKLRVDLAKFAAVRPFLFSKNIYCECYFICESSPPSSLKETGSGQNVNVLCLNEFQKLFFDFEKYYFVRSQRKFGSAVDPISGEKDTRKYIPVKYTGVSDFKDYSIEDIAQLLYKGKRIVLLGEYGTGKSRCIQELFSYFSNQLPNNVFYPIAIDLRDNWGTKRGHEIIQRHFDDLGIPELANSIIKVIESHSPCFLLDGFDEIGSQAWSDDPLRLSRIRAESLSGVKDLISKTGGGLIITGREHYFNSDDEMFSCLGLRSHNTILIRCASEFTDSEMTEYLQGIAPGIELPQWLPRRPLICQIISDMDRDTISVLAKEQSGETSFWNSLIQALCEREARIYPTLDPFTIRRVLRRVARITRTKSADVGPISISEINKAFEEVTGLPPVDDSAVMLQRLPGLGRLASESTDRQFVDSYILDGLRAEDLIEQANLINTDTLNDKWVNPLRKFGLTLLLQDIVTTTNLTGYYRLMRKSSERQNKILASDIMSAILCSDNYDCDFENLRINESHIYFVNMAHKKISNLSIENSIIDQIDLTDIQAYNVTIQNCIIQKVYGVSAAQGLPQWIKNNEIESYEALNTVARIRQAELSTNHRIFITLIKKLFFQPGSGRKEEALLRGLGSSADSKIADRILKLLMTNGIIDRFKGKEGWVYTPIRKHVRRMERIVTKLSLSEDDLWKIVEKY